jgi:hypothetical protein
MIRDPIVEEVRKIRHETEKACGYDWDRLIQHYRAVKTTGHRVVNRGPKRLPARGTGKHK